MSDRQAIVAMLDEAKRLAVEGVWEIRDLKIERDQLKAELAKLQAEREPRDNGDGTVTAMLPVTYPAGLPAVEARAPRVGERFLGWSGGDYVCKNGTWRAGQVRIILRHAPKQPKPVTWEAPLADGHWLAEPLAAYGNEGVRLPWSAIRGVDRPGKLGCYQFHNGVGTLIQEAGNE